MDSAGLGGQERGAVGNCEVDGDVFVGIGGRVEGFGLGGREGWFAYCYCADGT